MMALQQVNIGHTSALDHWYCFACPAHSRFLEKPTRENALECAQAFWELRDWLWRETYTSISMRDDQLKAQAFDQQLRLACAELAWLRDIAESAKHGGRLSRASVEVAGIGGGGGLGGLHQEFGPLGMVEHKPKCTLV